MKITVQNSTFFIQESAYENVDCKDVYHFVENQFDVWRTKHVVPLQWRHNERHLASQITGVSIVCSSVGWGADQRKHQNYASLAVCVGNSPVTGEFPAQRASNAENVSIWWRHHPFYCSRAGGSGRLSTRTGMPVGPKLGTQIGMPDG